MVHFPGVRLERPALAKRPSRRPWATPYRRFLKRGFDVAAVLLAAPLVLPLVLLLGLLIIRDGGPVFFCQDRIGRGGRVFRLWKLRSMVVDAERRLDELLVGDSTAR